MTAPFQPVPVVTLNGAALAHGGAASQVVLTGLAVTWGADDAVGQPDPPTATLAVFDRSRVWALRSDLVGDRITLGWSHTDSRGTFAGTFFDGRVSRVVTAPARLGGVDGALVTLSCSHVVADLANVVPDLPWPLEGFDARAGLISSEVSMAIGYTVSVDPTYSEIDVAAMAAVDAGSQVNLLDHIAGLFASAGGDRYTIDSAAKTIVTAPRPTAGQVDGVAGLATDTQNTGPAGSSTVRAYGRTGVYARAFPVGDTTKAPAGEHIDGEQLEDLGGEFSRTDAQRITHARIEYDTAAASRAVPNSLDPATKGRRTAQLSARFARSATTAGTAALNRYANRLGDEGQAWRYPAMRYQAARFGGFSSLPLMQALLSARERPTTLFLARSMAARLGLRPVVRIVGGAISYTDDGWEVDVAPVPLHTARTLAQHRITWDEMGSLVEWRDTPHAKGMHESLTYEDLLYVATPPGSTTPIPNAWDEVYK